MTYDLASFQYAFSTMAQTVGAGFAFLIAVVTPQIQGKLGTFGNRARHVRDYLRQSRFVSPYLNLTLSGEQWVDWVVLARYVGWSDVPSSEHAERVLKGLERDLDFVDFVQDKTKRALQQTVVVIVFCFLVIPFMNQRIITSTSLYALSWYLLVLTTALAVKTVLSFLRILTTVLGTSTVTIPPVKRYLPIQNLYMCTVELKSIHSDNMNILIKLLQPYNARVDEMRFNSEDNSLSLPAFDVQIEHQTQAWRDKLADELKRAVPTAQVRIVTYRPVDGKQQGVEVTFRR